MPRSLFSFLNVMGFWICMAVVLFVTPSSALAKNDPNDDKTQKQNGGAETDVCQWYLLLNVTIPPGSALRLRSDISKPPHIYVIIKKDGKVIGTTSWATGWSVDFPHKLRNKFPIRGNSQSRYTIEVWDYDTFTYDQNIFNTTQVKGEEFNDENGQIFERGSKFDDEDSLSFTKWKKIKTPAKYRDN